MRNLHAGAALETTLTREIVRNGLLAAVEEASIVVVHSSHSTFIQEGADACAALVDSSGQLVAQSVATSLLHGSSVRMTAKSVIAAIGLDSMVPGDVYVLNDPYLGGIHANDLVIFKPIFAEGRVVMLSATLIHVSDLGGIAVGGLATLATDTFSEGLTVPPVRLYSAGQRVGDIERILRRNSRAPEAVMGDIDALVAGANVASAGAVALIERYGAEAVEEAIAADLDATEARMRQELATIPGGTFDGEFLIDSDGIVEGHHVVRVQVVVENGSLVIDFDGTDPQSGGSINSSVSQTLSGVVFAVRCFVDASIPMNEGCFRPLDIRLPRGTLVNPSPPAACGGRIVTVCAAIEAVLEALSTARPTHAVAGSGLVHVFTMSGKRPTNWMVLLYDFGGLGARNGVDGPFATGAFFLGGRSVIPQIEPIEAQYPIRFVRSALRPDSGGAGTWRGGLGIETVIEALEDTTLTVRSDRVGIPPPGRSGGSSGLAGVSVIEHLDGSEVVLRPKQVGISLAPGDRFVLRTSGGGGLGEAFARRRSLVAADIRDGLVSAIAGASLYGHGQDDDAANDAEETNA